MNAEFITDLVTRHISGKWNEVVAPFSFYSADQDVTLVVPPGFVTDHASVPRFPLAYWLYGGRGDKAAVLHDMGYRFGPDFMSRQHADLLFNEALKADGKCGVIRWPMVAAVMTFGGLVYNPKPGCLDYRSNACETVPDCIYCPLCYSRWRDCSRSGYHPELWQEHAT
jgi:hypothetical protein